MNGAAEFMLVFAVLFLVYQLWQRLFRCHYCGGEGGGHEVHCPYNLDREERR